MSAIKQTKAELQKENTKLRQTLSKVLNDIQKHCYHCCGQSITEAKRCGMKPTFKGRTLVSGCLLYPYNPRKAEELRELYTKKAA